MALANTNITGLHVPTLGNLVGVFARIVENHPRSRQVATLNATSDAELARRGVTREEVIRHIFRDRYYL
ncbi:DUF1127 domain-containing protein [Rhodovulum adriaticum]|uniref:DUF1127 domain-containing protein n=1 Tax=Rhodovulum adriaticum TaxID=35804 RepID=A0A4R2NV50_RHOAD|nr:DUF1127 domain-containing protein [Rhodovulum adriaticum]MBK1636896.1 hypothetical protein [Rhodovulum adriaticum]TCP25451.1 hypothetical protein EV656_103203 [Rhodovulum adriaticum]